MGLVDKLKRLNKRGKRDLALLMFVTILAGANGLNSCSGNKDKKKLYLVDIKDEYQDELFLKNKDGNFLELMDSNNYVSKYPKVVENIGLRQIAGDKTLGDIQVDYDFIDKVYFENILKNRLGISNIIR